MTIEKVLPLLEGVRRTSRGWMGECPGHDDRNPSLSIREGERGVLLKCFASCSIQDITTAMGITVRDLFYDEQSKGMVRGKTPPKPWRFNWRRTAAEFQFHAEGLWLPAQSVLDAARGVNAMEWRDEEFDVAMNAVSRAYANMDRADHLEAVACQLRLQGLKKEQCRHAADRDPR